MHSAELEQEEQHNKDENEEQDMEEDKQEQKQDEAHSQSGFGQLSTMQACSFPSCYSCSSSSRNFTNLINFLYLFHTHTVTHTHTRPVKAHFDRPHNWIYL